MQIFRQSAIFAVLALISLQAGRSCAKSTGEVSNTEAGTTSDGDADQAFALRAGLPVGLRIGLGIGQALQKAVQDQASALAKIGAAGHPVALKVADNLKNFSDQLGKLVTALEGAANTGSASDDVFAGFGFLPSLSDLSDLLNLPLQLAGGRSSAIDVIGGFGGMGPAATQVAGLLGRLGGHLFD